MLVSAAALPPPQNSHKVFDETQLKVIKDKTTSIAAATGVGIAAAAAVGTVGIAMTLFTSAASPVLLPIGLMLLLGGDIAAGLVSAAATYGLAEMVKNCNLRELTIEKLTQEGKFTDLFRINDILTDKEKYLVRRLFLERLKEINKQINTEITDADLVNRPAGIAKGDLLVEKLGALRQYKESLTKALIREVPTKPVCDGNEAIEEIIRKLRKVGLAIELGDGIVAAIPGRIKKLKEVEQEHKTFIQNKSLDSNDLRDEERVTAKITETKKALEKASEKNEDEQGPAPTAPLYAPAAVEELGGKPLGYDSATPAYHSAVVVKEGEEK